jgi:hypothetical protein
LILISSVFNLKTEFSLEDELTEMARVGLCSVMFLFAKLNLNISFSYFALSPWSLSLKLISCLDERLALEARISSIGWAFPSSRSEYASASDSESDDQVA